MTSAFAFSSTSSSDVQVAPSPACQDIEKAAVQFSAALPRLSCSSQHRDAAATRVETNSGIEITIPKFAHLEPSTTSPTESAASRAHLSVCRAARKPTPRSKLCPGVASDSDRPLPQAKRERAQDVDDDE